MTILFTDAVTSHDIMLVIWIWVGCDVIRSIFSIFVKD